MSCGHSHNQVARPTTAAQPSIPTVTVNDITISEDHIARELQYHPADNAEMAVHQAARALAVRSLLLQRAQQLSVGGEARAGESREEADIRALIEREVQVPDPDEATCRRYYAANPAKFTTAPLMEVDHILLEVAADDGAGRRQQRDHAEDLLRRLEKEPDLFAEFAREFSACPSKQQGGNLGQLSRGQTVPEFEKQLFRLPEGLARRPIETRYGFHVVQVAHRIDGVLMPYEQCRDKIEDYLRNHAFLKAVSQYIDVLVGEARITGLDLAGASTPLVQ